jgi:hypothetical protein
MLSFNINFSSYATCSDSQHICDSLGISFIEAHVRRYGFALFSEPMTCWLRLETCGGCALLSVDFVALPRASPVFNRPLVRDSAYVGKGEGRHG